MSLDGQRTDRALVRQCLSHDQDACTDLVHRYQRMVHAVVWRTTRDHGHVDDLVQETFMRVFRGLPHFGARAKLSTWIYTIAWRVAVDHERSLVRCEQHVAWADDDRRGGANPEHLMAQREATSMLREELELLADHYRLPLMHVAIHELRYEAVSQLLGIPIGTVKGNVFYAKRMLRTRLEQRVHSPGT